MVKKKDKNLFINIKKILSALCFFYYIYKNKSESYLNMIYADFFLKTIDLIYKKEIKWEKQKFEALQFLL